MKRMCGAVGVLLFVTFTLSSCASYVTYQVRFPTFLGLGEPRANLQVMNNTPFVAVIFATNRYSTTLGRGETAEALEFVPQNGQPEPLIALMYEYAGNGVTSRSEYVGAAHTIVPLLQGRASVWVITSQDIAFVKQPTIALTTPKLAGFPRIVHFAHTFTQGMLTVQIVNNSRYDVELKGRKSAVGMTWWSKKEPVTLRPGNIYITQVQQFYYQQPGNFYIQARYLDGGRFVKDEFLVFTTSPVYPAARQVILSGT